MDAVDDATSSAGSTSSGATLLEVSAAGSLHVVLRGDAHSLYHAGTCEVRDLRVVVGESASVRISEEGAVVVSFTDPEREHACHTDMLHRALCVVGPHDDSEVFVV